MVFAPSGGVVEGGCVSSGGGAGGGTSGAAGALACCRCSCVSAGCLPTIVAFFAVMGRICGALARGSACEDAVGCCGRAAGAIARGVSVAAGTAGPAGPDGLRMLAGEAAAAGVRLRA